MSLYKRQLRTGESSSAATFSKGHRSCDRRILSTTWIPFSNSASYTPITRLSASATKQCPLSVYSSTSFGEGSADKSNSLGGCSPVVNALIFILLPRFAFTVHPKRLCPIWFRSCFYISSGFEPQPRLTLQSSSTCASDYIRNIL